MKHTTEHLIGIGFCQPKFYKRHIWLKARRIMEWLCDNTKQVQRYDFGRGKGKYITVGTPTPTHAELAAIYDRYEAAMKELLATPARQPAPHTETLVSLSEL